MSSLKEKKISSFTVWNMVSECPVNKGYVQETKPCLGTMQSYMCASYLSLPKHQAQKKYHLKSSPVELLNQTVKCFAAEFPSGCRTFTCQFLQESPCDKRGPSVSAESKLWFLWNHILLKDRFCPQFYTHSVMPEFTESNSFPCKKVLHPYTSKQRAPYIILTINCFLSRKTFMPSKESMIPT